MDARTIGAPVLPCAGGNRATIWLLHLAPIPYPTSHISHPACFWPLRFRVFLCNSIAVSRALKFALLFGVQASLVLALVYAPGLIRPLDNVSMARSLGLSGHAARPSVAATPRVHRAGVRHRVDDHRHQPPSVQDPRWHPGDAWRRCSRWRRWLRSSAFISRRSCRRRRSLMAFTGGFIYSNSQAGTAPARGGHRLRPSRVAAARCVRSWTAARL